MAEEPDDVPWAAILGLQRDVASLRETVARLDERQGRSQEVRGQWEAGAKMRLDEINEKMDNFVGELRNAIQTGVSSVNVATVELGKRVTGIEIDRAREKGQLIGGMAVIGGLVTAGGAVGSGITFLMALFTGHWK